MVSGLVGGAKRVRFSRLDIDMLIVIVEMELYVALFVG